MHVAASQWLETGQPEEIRAREDLFTVLLKGVWKRCTCDVKERVRVLIG